MYASMVARTHAYMHGCMYDLRTLKRNIGDVSYTAVGIHKMFNATNYRQVRKDLGRYMEANLSQFNGVQCVSFCGPDSTKIGTDFRCSISALLNSDTSVACVGAVQDAT